ncbi:type II secretion system protein [bacterium]|nr:type II secretion system protein [bacterium]
MNSEQSRQSRVNREQNGINANNCRTVNSRQFTHNAILSTIHSLAFTLAETLIVMGIIGVVAALTIPNMNYLDASHTSDEDAGVCKNGHQLTIEEPSCK